MKIVPLLIAAALVAYAIARWRRISNERRAIVLLAAAGFAVYGSGVIHLPNVEKTIEDIGTALGTWTYLLVGALAFLETGAFIGLIAPGETAILVGGVVAGQGKINILVLIAIVWGAAVAGDITSYVLGRRLGRGFLLRHGPKVQITESRLEQVERFYARHGGKAILLGRFIGLVRAVSPFIAGASHLPFRRFLPYDIVGAGLWGSAFCILGYVFWQSFDKGAKLAGRGALALGTTIVVVGGAIAAYRYLREPANRQKVGAWLDEHEQRTVEGPPIRAARALDRRVLRPAWRRVAGPARFVWNRLTPGQLGLELTTLLAIALVGGFTFIMFGSLLDTRSTLPLDIDSLRVADDVRSGMLTDLAKVITALGTYAILGPVLALTIGWLAMRRRAMEAIALAIGAGLTVIAVHLTKATVDRPRPFNGLVDTEGSSYPSGHAANAIAWVAIAVVLVRVGPGLAGRFAVVAVGLAIAAVVGLSRVYLRAHYLSDVVGGWALGAAAYSTVGLIALVVAFFRHNGRRA